MADCATPSSPSETATPPSYSGDIQDVIEGINNLICSPKDHVDFPDEDEMTERDETIAALMDDIDIHTDTLYSLLYELEELMK